MRTRLTAVALVLAGFAALAPASPAFAAAPVVEGPTHAEGTSEIADCGSFTILDQFSTDFTLRLFFDRDGTLVRLEEQVSGTDTFVNSETGEAIPTSFHNAVHIDPDAGLGANTGVVFRVTLPGSGAVFLDVGRIVTNQAGTIVAFEAGPHQFFGGDFAGLCEALA